MSDTSQFSSKSSTQRFRKVGQYSQDQLLRDLQELNAEVQALRAGIGSGLIKGDKGDTGAPGVKGDTGASGADGAPGANGLSAYELFVALTGYRGSVYDFVRDLQIAINTGSNPNEYELPAVIAGHLYADFGPLDRDYGDVIGVVLVTRDYGNIDGTPSDAIDLADGPPLALTEDGAYILLEDSSSYVRLEA